MKKTSINSKLSLCFSALVLLVILAILILNSTVLEGYYQNFKEKSLIKVFNSINETYISSSGDDDYVELEKIETNQNMDIVIKDGKKLTVYSTSKDFSNNLWISRDYVSLNIDYINNHLSDTTSYFTTIISDDRIHSEFVALFGKLDNGYMVFIRTPIESIKESVSVTNKFLLLVGVISITAAGILSLFISESFTKPIKEVTNVAKSISELDFSKYCLIDTNDEIETLGNSINILSKKLETKIQELNNANIELEKDVEQKSKLAEMRSQFVSDVSHELKTPIALIQGYAEGLIDGIATTEEDKKYYLEVILDEANKMSSLTHDLLDLSNLEYGKNNLNIERFNLIELISGVIKKNEIIFNEKKINCSFVHDDDELYVDGDIFRIEQVLTNYINNAVKNIDDNKDLKIIIVHDEKKAKIRVFNSGKHIERENLSRIWTKFYKVDSARTRDLSGSGIGLSLVKAIMDQHKNHYGVNNVDGGVEFWFELNINKESEIV
jgi:two-component system sensor histidine kinase VanS